jgi:hypothetical protein
MKQLGHATPRLLCSLVHKFGRKDVDDFDAYIKELQAEPTPSRASAPMSLGLAIGPVIATGALNNRTVSPSRRAISRVPRHEDETQSTDLTDRDRPIRAYPA